MNRQDNIIRVHERLMSQVRDKKAESRLSNAQIGIRMGRTRVASIRLLQSKNISLQNFISLAEAVGLDVDVKANGRL